MPCNDGGYTSEQLQQQKIDCYAVLLCEACSLLEQAKIEHLGGAKPTSLVTERAFRFASVELLEWWIHHQEIDRKRLAEEKAAKKKAELKSKALKKLTKEEKEALGILSMKG